MTARREPWTVEEDAKLRELYPHHSTKRVAELLGIHEDHIASRAARLGVKKTPETIKRSMAKRTAASRAKAREASARGLQLDPEDDDPEILARIRRASKAPRFQGRRRCPYGCTGDPNGFEPVVRRNACPYHGHVDPDASCTTCGGLGVAPSLIDEWGLCYIGPCGACETAAHNRRRAHARSQEREARA